MPEFWTRPLATFALFVLAALVAWAIVGGYTALFLLVICLGAYLVYHLRQLESLNRWLVKPELKTIPQGHGLWEETFSQLFKMARRQSASQHHLSATLVRFQRAGEAMPDGVVILTESDEIEWFNTVAQLQFGLNPETDTGRPITYLLRQTQFHEYLAAHNYSEPLIIHSTRHPENTLSIQLIPFGDKQKLLLSRDISHFERMETMRRDFIANVSHELRTPLTVVGGFLESLQDQQHLSEAEREHFFNLMLDQTQRMERLVEDLLTLSRLESAANPLQEDVVDVPTLVRQLFDEARGLSQGQHEIVLELNSEAKLLGSESELRSAFGNLVSNAVRYTPAGGRIVVRWEEVAGEARFSVQDSGIGIESQHIPRLTERFYRVDRSRSRETGGTGLGLSIVKHVLNRHQGRLEVQSVLGKGSTFSAVLPHSRIATMALEGISEQ